MLSVNPFSDPSIKKQILEDSGVSVDPNIEIEEPVDFSDFQNIIDTTPVIPGKADKALKTIIHDASLVVKNSNEERANAMSQALSDVMSQYNEKYGLSLNYDFRNVANTIVLCSSEKNTKVLELYVSRICKTIRPILILGMISKLSLALETLLAPENLLDKSQLSLTDLFIATDSILGYISKLEEIMSSITIQNEDLELKRLAEESGMEYKEEDQELVEKFMSIFKKENGIS